MDRNYWNRCDICGKFIAIHEFRTNGTAVRELLTSDTAFTAETYETYHKSCSGRNLE